MTVTVTTSVTATEIVPVGTSVPAFPAAGDDPVTAPARGREPHPLTHRGVKQ